MNKLKSRYIFLLGAGASVEAEIPASLSLTKRIADANSIDAADDIANSVLWFVLGALKLQRGSNASNPLLENIDVEELISAVVALRDKETNQLTPFVATWNPAVDSLGARSSLSRDLIINAILQTELTSGPIPTTSEEFQKKVKSFLVRAVNKYGRLDYSEAWKGVRTRRGSEVFEAAVDVTLHRLSKLTWLDPEDESTQERVNYLRPLSQLAEELGSLCVTTLNYDNTVEMATGADCATGIQEWSLGKRLKKPEKGIYLLKLHGSIDWYFEVKKREPIKDVVLTGSPWHKHAAKTLAKYDKELAIIFGRGNKLRPDGPFLDLLFEFRSELDNSDKLIAVGYSFRDPHVNDQIRRWLLAHESAQLIAIAPSIVKDCPPWLMKQKKERPTQIDLRAITASAAFEQILEESHE
jgi:hypothetical protein